MPVPAVMRWTLFVSMVPLLPMLSWCSISPDSTIVMISIFAWSCMPKPFPAAMMSSLRTLRAPNSFRAGL